MANLLFFRKIYLYWFSPLCFVLWFSFLSCVSTTNKHTYMQTHMPHIKYIRWPPANAMTSWISIDWTIAKIYQLSAEKSDITNLYETFSSQTFFICFLFVNSEFIFSSLKTSTIFVWLIYDYVTERAAFDFGWSVNRKSFAHTVDISHIWFDFSKLGLASASIKFFDCSTPLFQCTSFASRFLFCLYCEREKINCNN